MGALAVASTKSNNSHTKLPNTPTSENASDRLLVTTHDLFELLERVQSSRLDDQRCVLPQFFTQSQVSVRTHSNVF
jgi:hypothetical protein